MATYLDEVLSFSLGDKRLKLRCCECVHQTSLRDNEEEDLSAGKNRQFICLRRDISKSFAKPKQGLARQHGCRVKEAIVLTFFMIPAFRLENVI
jgi:hypothetical protein